MEYQRIGPWWVLVAFEYEPACLSWCLPSGRGRGGCGGCGKGGVGVRRGVFGTLLGPEITGLVFCGGSRVCVGCWSVTGVRDGCGGCRGVGVSCCFWLFLRMLCLVLRGRVWV